MEYTFTNLLELKKDKAAIHAIRQWLFTDKSFSEILLAKYLSSCLTHAFIEVEHADNDEQALEMALGYRVDLLATIVHNLVLGLTTPEVSRKVLMKVIEDEKHS